MADEENKSQQPEEEAKQVTPAVPSAEETPTPKAKAPRDEAKKKTKVNKDDSDSEQEEDTSVAAPSAKELLTSDDPSPQKVIKAKKSKTFTRASPPFWPLSTTHTSHSPTSKVICLLGLQPEKTAFGALGRAPPTRLKKSRKTLLAGPWLTV